MSNRTNNTSTGTNYNPTITALFENEKFGEGALLSAAIDSKAFRTVQQSLEIGSKLVVRKSKKANKNGGSTYFLEILPAQADSGNNRQNSRNDSGI